MSVVGIAVAAFESLVEGAISKATGKGKDDHPDLASTIKNAVRDELAALDLEARAEAVARKVIDALQLGLLIRDVADQVADVTKAFVPDGSVPDLGLDITEVGPDGSIEPSTISPVDDREGDAK